MREIKFRAWNNLTKEMLSWDKVIEYEYSITIFQQAVEQHVPGVYVLMQYTGLKDKNGVEVCEGDRVCIADRPSKTGIVQWYNGCLYAQGDDGWMQDFTAEQECDGSVFEVIGNIYENPELLKEAA